MRVVGLDIHRVFAEAVLLDDGKVVRLGRIGMTRDHLGAFARTLTYKAPRSVYPRAARFVDMRPK